MKYKIILIILLLFVSCSTAKKATKKTTKEIAKKPAEKDIKPNLYELLKTKEDLNLEEKQMRAFIYKLEGKYSKSYQLFKGIVSQDRENYNNLIFLNVMDYVSSYCNRENDLNQFYEKLLTNVTNQYLSDSIRYYLMLNYLPQHPEKAKKLQQQLGFITDFFIIGPFKNENRAGMETIYPPEIKIEPQKDYSTSTYHTLKWRPMNIHQLNGINLENYFTPDENCIAYLLLYINVTNTGYYDIIYGSDDGIKIWVNNAIIVEEDIYRSAYFEQNRVKVLFKKGLNKILIKSSQEAGNWWLYFRILPLDYIITNTMDSEDTFLQQLSIETNYEILYSFYNINEKITNNFYKGFYYLVTGNYPDHERLHEKYFELCLKEENENPVYNYYYAFAQKEITESKQHYLESIKRYPLNIEARFQLGFYYYDLELYDQALQYFSEIEKINTNFCLIKFHKGLLFYRNSLYEQALREFSECEKNNVKLDEAYYYSGHIYWFSKDYEKAYNYFLKSFYQDPYEYNLSFENKLVNYLVANNNLSRISNLIQTSLNINKDDPSLLNNFSEFYLNRNEITKAELLINNSLSMDDYNPDTLKIASDIMLQQNKTNKAISYLEKIIETDVHNKNIKRRILFLQKKYENLIDNYAPGIDKIVKKIFKKSNREYRDKFKDASGIVFHDSQVTGIAENGAEEKLVTQIYYILNENGIEDFKAEKIDYNPDFDNVEIKIAKTIYRNQQEFEAFDIQTYSLINEEEKLYYKYNRKLVNFPKPKKDVVLVLQYHIWSRPESALKKTYFGDKIIGASFYPVLNKTYTLILPRNLKLYHNYRNFKTAPKLKTKTLKANKIYEWQLKNLSRIVYENPMPPIESSTPTIIVSTFRQWDEVGIWIDKLSKDQVSINDKMKEFVKKIMKKYKQKERIIEEIYNFVRDEIRYVGIEYGIGGIQPRNTISTWTSKYGDCKDKSLLMVALLKQAGIRAYTGLVRTQNRGEEDFKLPYLGAFNHAVCVVPLKNKNLFLDPTASYFDINEFPFYDRKNKIFLIASKNYRFISPPKFKKDENSLITIFSNTVYRELSMKSKIYSHRYNQFKPYLRYISMFKDEHKKNIESYWNSEHPGSHVLNLDYHIDKNMFEYNIHIDNFLHDSDNPYRFKPILSRIDLYKNYCTAKERKNEIIFDYPHTLETINYYKLDMDFKNISLPENNKLKNKFLDYEIKYEKENNLITVERVFRLKKTKILPENYLEFKKYCTEIDRFENEEIEIEK